MLVVYALMWDVEGWHEWTASVPRNPAARQGTAARRRRALVRQPYFGYEAAGLKKRCEEPASAQ